MFNFTSEQVDLLQAVRSTEMAKKLDVRFEMATDDEANKRTIIYQDGALDMLKHLLLFDVRFLEQKEAEKQDLLQKHQGSTPDDFQSFDNLG